jgi:HK97 family phage portal protein
MIDKIRSLLASPAAVPQTRGSSMSQVLNKTILGPRAATGVVVNEATALQSTAVFACVRILAESVGSLPLIVYERGSGRAKRRATDHPLYRLLHDNPNPEMTSMEFRETLMGHLALWGNAYAEIQYSSQGRAVGLWPLRPDRIEIKRDPSGGLYYQYRLNNVPIPLARHQVLHLKGLGYDGVKGYSPISLARQSIGLALGTEEFGGRFFGNGASPGGVLEHPGELGPEGFKRVQESWAEAHEGISNSFRIAILEEGMKYTQVGMPMQDAQFLETRKFQTSEIARLYRVPPHMIGDLEKATFSNIEHQGLEFVTHTLRPWLTRWEQSLGMHLMTESERQRYFVEHVVEGLLRGDIQTRYEAYAVGRQWGWLSINDIRALENMNPIGQGGDDYLTPLNMTEAGASGSEGDERELRAAPQQAVSQQQAQQRAIDDRVRLAGAFERVLLDTVGRVYRREINDIRRAVGKYLIKGSDLDTFINWLKRFYAEHAIFWARQMGPIMLAFAEQMGIAVAAELSEDPQRPEALEQFVNEYIAAFAARQTQAGQLELEALATETQIEEGSEALGPAIDERLDSWEEGRAETVARDEAARASNALVKQLYTLYAITEIVWRNRGSDNCPYCRDMDGKIVGITEFFLSKDTEYQPEGAQRPLSKRGDIGHPPLHKGCDCIIEAKR